MDNRIKVGIRVRPLSTKEQNENSCNAVSCDDQRGRIAVGEKKTQFGFDWVHGSNAAQRAIYEKMCLPLIDKCFEGYNATFFAYGQTGSGKTYTMGTTNDFTSGVVPFAVKDIIARKHALMQSSAVQCSVELSFIEIYLEDCFDLLHPEGEKKKLDLRETSAGETYLDGLTSVPIHTLQDVSHCIAAASKIRSTGKTAMNSASSRSHALCMFTLRVVKENASFVSKLNLVDLAGSERAKKTLATGDAFQEGVSINKGLLALGNVVAALCQKAQQMQQSNATGSGASTTAMAHVHVPYRESKLTRLLKDSLGGNGMTVLLACVSPAQSNADETLNTLRFAARASSIVNTAKVNVETQSDASSLLKEVNRLREQLVSLQSKYDALESESLKKSERESESDLAVKAKKRKSTESERESARWSISSGGDGERESAMSYLLSSHKLCGALRSLLTQVFEEDLALSEEEVLSLQRELSQVRQCLGLPERDDERERERESALFADAPGGEDMAALLRDLQMSAALPPIVLAMESLKSLERHFLLRMQPGSGTAEDAPRQKKRRISFADEENENERDRERQRERSSSRRSDVSEISLSSSAATESPCASMMREVQSPNLSSLSLSTDDDDREERETERQRERPRDGVARLSNSSLFSLSLDDELHELEAMVHYHEEDNEEEVEENEEGEEEAERGAEPAEPRGVALDAKTARESERANQRELLRAQAHLAAKERRMKSMSSLSLKYQGMIESLHCEIAQLERETSSLAMQEAEELEKTHKREMESVVAQNNENVNTTNVLAPSANSNTQAGVAKRQSVVVVQSSAEAQRVKALLKQKTKELEEKIRTLRQKESEFKRISSSREKLREDVELMQKKVSQCKARNVAMVKQMRVREAEHRTETQQFQKRELQTKRKVQQVEFAMKTLEQEVAAREKVWKARLEAKERESETLKDLLFRQREIAKQKEKQRELLAQSRGGSGASGALPNANSGVSGNIGSANSAAASRQLIHSVLSSQIARERQHAVLSSRLSLAIDKRRDLQKEKILCKSRMRSLRNGSQAHALSLQRVKDLERDIKRESDVVVELQVALSAQREKERESVLITGEKEREGSAALIGQCGESVSELKALVSLLWSQHCQEVAETAKQTLKVQALQQRASEEDAAEQRKTAKKQSRRNGDDNDNDALVDSEAEDQFDDYLEEQEESDEDFDPEQTFCASDNEDEDAASDADAAAAKDKKRLSAGSNADKKTKKKLSFPKKASRASHESARGKHRESVLMRSVDSLEDHDSDAGSVSSSLAGSPPPLKATKPRAPRRVVRKNRALEEIEVSAETVAASSWMKLTVKDLKTELANRNLTVSGVKNELVKRLVQFEIFNSTSSQEQHDDGMDVVSSPAANDENVFTEGEKNSLFAAVVQSMSSAPRGVAETDLRENAPAMDSLFTPNKSVVFKSPLFSPLKAPRRSTLRLPLSELLENDENSLTASSPALKTSAWTTEPLAENKRTVIANPSQENHLNWFDGDI